MIFDIFCFIVLIRQKNLQRIKKIAYQVNTHTFRRIHKIKLDLGNLLHENFIKILLKTYSLIYAKI